jgi:hypothetical protein
VLHRFLASAAILAAGNDTVAPQDGIGPLTVPTDWGLAVAQQYLRGVVSTTSKGMGGGQWLRHPNQQDSIHAHHL